MQLKQRKLFLRRNLTLIGALALVGVLTAPALAASGDTFTVKRMSEELARDIAQGALEACRETGYQVAAVVVDRNGDPVAILRDVFAPRVMIEIAMRTANTVVMSGVDSSEFVRNAKALAEKLDHLGITLSEAGAVRIEAADGSFLGAVSVSGAPTGEDDEKCVRKALNAVGERLMFGDM